MHVQTPQYYQQNAPGQQYGPPASQGGEQWQGAAWSGQPQGTPYQQGSPAYGAGPPAGQGESAWRGRAQPQQGDPCRHLVELSSCSSTKKGIALAWLHQGRRCVLQRRNTGRAGAPPATQSPLKARRTANTGAAEEGHVASERIACVPAGGQGWQSATQGQHPGQAAPQQQQQAASPMENVRVGTQNLGAYCPGMGARPCTEALRLQIKACSLRRKASAASAALATAGEAVPTH